MSTKLISLVLIGRNDNFGTDYLYRLSTSLSLIGRGIKEIRAMNKMEILVVDWASNGGPLADVVELEDDARQLVRFVEIDTKRAYRLLGTTRFNPTRAANVGIRRAVGKFIAYTDSDCLYSTAVLDCLVTMLADATPGAPPAEGRLFSIPRYQIPWPMITRQPTVNEWNRLLPRLAGNHIEEMVGAKCLGGFCAAQMMSAALWNEVQGYDEVLDRAWGWSDNDLALRVSQDHDWSDTGWLGIYAMHMGHLPKRSEEKKRDPENINPMLIPYHYQANQSDWGFGGEEFPIRSGTRKMSCLKKAHYLVEVNCDWNQVFFPGEELQKRSDQLTTRITELLDGIQIPEETLRVLSRLFLQRTPLRVMQIGSIEKTILGLYLRICPTLELFLVNPWVEGLCKNCAVDPGHLSNLLHSKFSFRGYARVILGDPRRSIERAVVPYDQARKLEAILIDFNMIQEFYVDMLQSSQNFLEPYGFCVIWNVGTEYIPLLNRLFTEHFFLLPWKADSKLIIGAPR